MKPRPAASKLPRDFYSRSTLVVARELIGMHLLRRVGHKLMRARIVETEAYQGPRDLAAHSSRGRTARTEVMFGPAGFAYVYLIYGFWDCLNVVTRTENIPHAVLIRAVEPVANIEAKTWGPGLLCRALEITRRDSGVDLCGDSLWIERPANFVKPRIERATRIGVDYAGDWALKPWRFFDRQSPYVSTVSASKRKKQLGARL